MQYFVVQIRFFGTMTQEDKFLATVREIILEMDRAEQEKVRQDVDLLKSEILLEEKNQQVVDPYFSRKIEYLKSNFPQIFGPFLSNAIKIQIRDSQDEVIDALYPIIGKLIRKYIATEIEVLGKQLDSQIQNTLSPDAWWKRIKAFVSGEKYQEHSVVKRPIVEEVFIIANDSGLLLGQYSFNNLIDADLIAGMLTGIKSFVEHAFNQGPQEIQSLEYENYKILVNSFPHYYMAFVVQGILTPEFKNSMYDACLDFSEKTKIKVDFDLTREYTEDISEKMKTYFQGFNDEEINNA